MPGGRGRGAETETALKHDELQPLPSSYIDIAALLFGVTADAILGLHRCSCGGYWAWVIDGDGLVQRRHRKEEVR